MSNSKFGKAGFSTGAEVQGAAPRLKNIQNSVYTLKYNVTSLKYPNLDSSWIVPKSPSRRHRLRTVVSNVVCRRRCTTAVVLEVHLTSVVFSISKMLKVVKYQKQII